MTTGNWYNSDSLPLQYGTSKATVEGGGNYSFGGSARILEVDLDTGLTLTGGPVGITNPYAISGTTFFSTSPNIQIDKVELIGETAVTNWTGLDLGFAYGNPFTSGGLTVISNTALLNAIAPWTAGNLTTYVLSSTGAGGFIGSYLNATNMTTPGYVTAMVTAGTAGTGKARVRVHYHGAGTIPN